MKIHHLNCGSTRYPGAPLVNHVLLLETRSGLVLVDTGYGTRDYEDPVGRFGPQRYVANPVLDGEKFPAIHQVRALGFEPQDVKHIILTHLDNDHIGGLDDFPAAKVHVSAAEVAGAITHPKGLDKSRFDLSHMNYGDNYVVHKNFTEPWHGFEQVETLHTIDPDIKLILLPGHTMGHCAVAVRKDTSEGSTWLVHAGDSFYHPGTFDPSRGKVPLFLRFLEWVISSDYRLMKRSRYVVAEHYLGDRDLFVVSAHDPALFEQAQML